MSAATSRYEIAPLASPAIPPALQRGDGAARVVFSRRGVATCIRRLDQRAPGRVLFPHAEAGEPALAMLLNTAGGLTGGDRMAIAIGAEPGAVAMATAAAAEKIYRAAGGEAAVEVALDVGPGAWLEWLPQETILFEGARLDRGIAARVADGGRLLAAEMLVFGRVARGERFAQGRLFDRWRIVRGDALAWRDALRLEGDVAALIDRPAGFDGAQSFATLVYVGGDAERHLPLARQLSDDVLCRGGATVVNGILLVRFLGAPVAVRTALAGAVGGLRQAAAGLPARPPRTWNM
jgi:urease accessory protein